jgi:hypothetical protein
MDDAGRYGRGVLALTGAATTVAAAFGGTALTLAGEAGRGHAPVAYLLTQLNHDIGHNDWAFQGGPAGRVGWIATYVALWLFWLGVALWMRALGRRRGHPAPWLRVVAAAWLVQLGVFLLSFAAVYGAAHTSSWPGPLLLRVADLCSPWWTCVAALTALAVAERGRLLIRATAGYAALLALLLLVPLPGPAWVWILLLAATAGVPAALAPAGPLPQAA